MNLHGLTTSCCIKIFSKLEKSYSLSEKTKGAISPRLKSVLKTCSLRPLHRLRRDLPVHKTK